jgi:cardiolipin synthase
MKTYLEAEDIQLVYSGSDYFNVLERMIDESRHSLHLQTYIFETDETGRKIVDALKKAAQRGVAVYMLIDAYGSYPFSKQVTKELNESGVHFRLFSPLSSNESIYFGRRLHHKIIVADKQVALTGGINIANKYSGSDGSTPWLDYAVLTRGMVCEFPHLLCEEFYHKKKVRRLRAWEKNVDKPGMAGTGKLVRFRRNDWIKRKNDIHKSYMEALIGAQSSVTIVASYFLPGRTFRKLLKSAARRGVRIRVILAGKSDISSLRLAESYLYDFYLRYNICIFEWTNSVMHGKAMLVDDNWATIGSYNLNFLSHYISIELNSDVRDPAFIRQFSDHLDNVVTGSCETVEMKTVKRKFNPFSQLLRWMAYNFYRLLMSFMMTGRKYRKRNR